MIAERSDSPTGKCCLLCNNPVTRPWGARPDEYLVCRVCAAGGHREPERLAEDTPDLSESFWRIATGSRG